MTGISTCCLATVTKALGTPERTHLIEIVFTALNKSGTGYLNADEMRLFANQTGDSDSFGMQAGAMFCPPDWTRPDNQEAVPCLVGDWRDTVIW